ncbi:Carbonic anhydrase alpha-class protein [Dioscorea alata]|uniref:Carbonic anhydrase alpha-class protein n=1 Tax=Dioscorea alata TaxID=55571 RepID=A0ACB7UQ02_DIOAL|nr:Carbonic anhydrase alpha-class protein [Dioscorea alata]
MKVLVFLFMILLTQVSTHANASDVDYNYIKGDQKGPKNWWRLSSDWKTCGYGNMQSPIDLTDAQKDIKLGNLKMNYKPTNAILLNKGHEVELQWEGEAGYLEIDSIQYSLTQIHWHNPSEHQIEGTSYDLEAHMVHESKDGKTAVIAILYKLGASNHFLEKLEDNVKKSESQQTQYVGVIDPKSVLGVMDTKIIPFENYQYYRYIGSFTTPPCSEGVIWTVINKVGTVSADQVAMFQYAQEVGSKENARPLQPRDGRLIKIFNPLF